MTDWNRSAYSRSSATVARPRGAEIDQGLRAYMVHVYNYMALGLGISGLTAYVAFKFGTVAAGTGHVMLTPFGETIFRSPVRWLVVLAPLAVVLILSGGINRMSAGTARMAFLVFSALMGLSMSALFLVYTHGSIGRVFVETGAAFGALSLYGYTTKRDLSAMGSFLMMGLFGLIIASFVNVFMQSSGLQWALSIVCIGVFAGLTAYDTQQIRDSYFTGDGADASEKRAIFGALQLYLDFINIFQALLQLTGTREE